jgi:hypothetical protein
MRRGLLILNIGNFIELCKQFLDIVRVFQTVLSKLIILLLLRSQLLLSLPLFRLKMRKSSLFEHHHLLGPRNLR